MRRIVNLNGTSRDDLVAQQRAVMDAADTLLEAMGMANPHGRDYQLNADPTDYQQDRDEWQEKRREAQDIRDYAYLCAMGIQDGK